jgi:hypothetical protein
MFKKLILVGLSISCFYTSILFAQSKEQIGIKLAECSAYNSHAFTIAIKIFKDNKMMQERKLLMEQNWDFADKLIGKTQANEVILNTSKLARTYQNDTQAYVNFVGKNIQDCDNFVINNSSIIKRALSQ